MLAWSLHCGFTEKVARVSGRDGIFGALLQEDRIDGCCPTQVSPTNALRLETRRAHNNGIYQAALMIKCPNPINLTWHPKHLDLQSLGCNPRTFAM